MDKHAPEWGILDANLSENDAAKIPEYKHFPVNLMPEQIQCLGDALKNALPAMYSINSMSDKAEKEKSLSEFYQMISDNAALVEPTVRTVSLLQAAQDNISHLNELNDNASSTYTQEQIAAFKVENERQIARLRAESDRRAARTSASTEVCLCTRPYCPNEASEKEERMRTFNYRSFDADCISPPNSSSEEDADSSSFSSDDVE